MGSEQSLDHRPTDGEPRAGRRGSNQSGMRAYNERLVLSLVRRHGALAKSDIARITGLSPQTISVIMRSLETDGLLMRGEPVRGRVGQPSVPLSLVPRGALFFGLKIGRRSAEMVLVDFAGTIIGSEQRRYKYPMPGQITRFTADACAALRRHLEPHEQERIVGLGVATPFELWNWGQLVGAPAHDMDQWRDFDMQTALTGASGCEVFVENDASAACGAELVFGKDPPRDFLYIYIGFFAGGGLVLDGTLFTGRSGTAAAIGPMPVPGASGKSRQLLEVASMAALEQKMAKAGGDILSLYAPDLNWEIDPDLLQTWIEEAGRALAHTVVAGACIVDLECCLIDGWLPGDVKDGLVEATRDSLGLFNRTGLEVPQIRGGTVGPGARSLGAASVPLASRFLVHQNAFLK